MGIRDPFKNSPREMHIHSQFNQLVFHNKTIFSFHMFLWKIFFTVIYLYIPPFIILLYPQNNSYVFSLYLNLSSPYKNVKSLQNSHFSHSYHCLTMTKNIGVAKLYPSYEVLEYNHLYEWMRLFLVNQNLWIWPKEWKKKMLCFFLSLPSCVLHLIVMWWLCICSHLVNTELHTGRKNFLSFIFS